MDLASPLPPVDLLRSRAPARPGPGADPEAVKRAAEAFEASFLSALLQPMFAGLSTEAPFGGGHAEETFRSFLVEAMAKQTVRAGGVGLSDAVRREMLKLQGA